MTEVLGKIMAEVLSIFALTTKKMTRRLFSKPVHLTHGLWLTMIKRLLGRTDVENALKRLDILTQEEMRMAVAINLEVTHGIDDNVEAIEAITSDVGGNVNVLKEVTRGVDNNVRAIREGV